ncbi:glycosyltransferase family 2 protein [Candidatus Saccharibacteria bacterium]|nr:glycosyltransferase family 2 protein [Candidatus Saccharibacteria bacterium]
MGANDTKHKYPLPSEASLSIIIPAYNSEKWIGDTLEHLGRSLKNSTWRKIEIIVVDDGSTDKTAENAQQTNIGIPIRIIRQKNSGRLLARENGLKSAGGDYVLLLDSRIYTAPGSFKYLQSQINKNREAIVWNGHINMDRRGNPFARFWYTITFLAWRRYMKTPRLTSYGEKDYDYYPKGTTGFFAPKDFLLEAYKNFTTNYSDSKNANDDTSLIRYITKLSDIHISPDYAFTYVSRSSLRAFIPHTLHRGIVFIDGHFHRGSRYFYACLLYLILVPVVLFLVILNPVLLLLLIPLLIFIFAFAKILGTETADAAALAYVMPLFAVFYTAGFYKGLYLRVINHSNKP